MKKYQTEEERKQARKEYLKQYYQKNKEKMDAYKKQYRKDNPNYDKQYCKQYSKSPMGRASNLVNAYKQEDKKHNRGECTLTARWLVDNIFNKPCAHCGKTGWQVIGCNRLDNSRPHTEDNVEPCCFECNAKLAASEKKQILAKQVYQYTLDGELVKVWQATAECGRNGYDFGHVAACCRGERKTHKGYIWKYSRV